MSFKGTRRPQPLRDFLLCASVCAPHPHNLDSRQCLALLSFSKTLYPHCCSPPRCINGYPVGCECYLSLDVACVRPWSGAWPECSPGSWEAALWVHDWCRIQWPGVIIHCEALWVVSHTRKPLHKNQWLLLLCPIRGITLLPPLSSSSPPHTPAWSSLSAPPPPGPSSWPLLSLAASSPPPPSSSPPPRPAWKPWLANEWCSAAPDWLNPINSKIRKKRKLDLKIRVHNLAQSWTLHSFLLFCTWLYLPELGYSVLGYTYPLCVILR